MEKVAVNAVVGTNVVSIESRKSRIPTLTELAKSDPDVKEMVRLIVQYDLRDKAVALLNKKLTKKKRRPVFFGSHA